MRRVEHWPPEAEIPEPNQPAKLVLTATPWAELSKPVSYADNLLGNRFLERGQGLLLYGPAGCGKSVAGLQGCVEWSAGLDGLHIAPVQPLRIVIIQTEDSLDDTREALAGIRASSCLKPEHQEAIERNLFILPAVPGGSPDILARYIEQAATQFKPDLLLVNPLLAFCPGDPARELGGILYGTVDPIIKRHRLGFLGVHHTPKTNNRDTSDYGRHDHQYLAAGDARVANWPRAMVQIEEVRYPTYRFRIAKRGARAGWTWDGKPTTERYFQHHACEVRWIDAMPEAVTEAKQTENYREIVSVLPAPDKPGISRDRVQENAKAQLGIGKHKADSWLKLAIEDGIVERIEVESEHKRKEATFRLKEVGK